jgi:hypothetical protein
MAQITRITSEALQATIRRLLPSQQGFGEDLEATNVITPIIDLTPSAEGSVLTDYLQQALAHSSQTSFNIQSAGTTNLVSTPGFYRVIGMVDFIAFLRAGDTLRAYTDSLNTMSGSTRQIADVDGNLVNPAGFTIT